MSRRLVVALAILASGPLLWAGAWPLLAVTFLAADLSLALVAQPREELVVAGHLFGAAAFSLETLSVEEPGQEPYQRQVSLDAERGFELALGEPRRGSYRVSLQTGTADSQAEKSPRWLRTAELVASGPGQPPQQVVAREYNYSDLLLAACATAAAQASLLAGWLLLTKNRKCATA